MALRKLTPEEVKAQGGTPSQLAAKPAEATAADEAGGSPQEPLETKGLKSEAGGAALRGVGRGLTMNFDRRLGAGFQASLANFAREHPKLAAMAGIETGYGSELPTGEETFRKAFQENTAREAADRAQQGGAALAGEFGGSLAPSIIGGGLPGMLAQGAISGAGSADQPGATAEDYAKGAAIGLGTTGALGLAGKRLGAAMRAGGGNYALRALGLVPSALKSAGDLVPEVREAALQAVRPWRGISGNTARFKALRGLAGEGVESAINAADVANPKVAPESLGLFQNLTGPKATKEAEAVARTLTGRLNKAGGYQPAQTLMTRVQVPSGDRLVHDAAVERMVRAIELRSGISEDAARKLLNDLVVKEGGLEKTAATHFGMTPKDLGMGPPRYEMSASTIPATEAWVGPAELQFVKQQAQNLGYRAQSLKDSLRAEALKGGAADLRSALIKASGEQGPEVEAALAKSAPFEAIGPHVERAGRTHNLLTHLGLPGAAGLGYAAFGGGGKDPWETAQRGLEGAATVAALRSGPSRALFAHALSGVGGAVPALGISGGKAIGGLLGKSPRSGQSEAEGEAMSGIKQFAPPNIQKEVAGDPQRALIYHQALKRLNPQYAQQTQAIGTSKDTRRP